MRLFNFSPIPLSFSNILLSLGWNFSPLTRACFAGIPWSWPQEWTAGCVSGAEQCQLKEPCRPAPRSADSCGKSPGQGSLPPASHAFRAQTAADPALQRAEQELLRDPDPAAGQQRDRVHAVRGEHGAGVPGSCGAEARIARGKGRTTCRRLTGLVFSSALCLWVMLFSGLARCDQQLELGQTDCVNSEAGRRSGLCIHRGSESSV